MNLFKEILKDVPYKNIGKNISIYYKYFFSYMVILLVPLLIFGFILFDMAVDKLNNEIGLTYSYKMEQIANDIDSQFDNMTSIAFSLANNTLMKPYLIKKNAYNEIEAINEMKKYKEKSFLVSECIYYIKGDNEVYTSSGKYYNDIYLNNIVRFTNWDSFIEDVNNCNNPFIRPRENALLNRSESDQVITYIYPVSTNITSYKNAAVIFIITKQSLIKRIQNLVGELNGKVYVFNPINEHVISYDSTQAGTQTTDNKIPGLVKEIFSLQDGLCIKEAEIEGKKFNIFKITSSKMGYKYVLLLPWMKFAEQATQMKSVMGKIIIIALSIGVLLVLFFSNVNYRPIKKLIRTLKELRPLIIDEKSGNEMASISSAIKTTIGSNDSLKSRVDEQNKWMKHQVLYSLLKGSFEEELKEKFESFQLRLKGPYYCIMVISIVNVSKKSSYGYKDGILNMIEADYSCKGISYGIDIFHRDCVAVIYNFTDETPDERYNEAVDIVSRCNGIDTIVKVGVGSICIDLKKLNKSYIEALSAIEYIESKKDRDIMVFEEMVKTYTYLEWYSSEEIIRLVQSIKQGDELLALENLNKMVSAIKDKNISHVMGKYICIDIVNSVIKIIREINLDITPAEISELAAFDDLNELRRNMTILVQKMCRLVNESMQNMSFRLMNNIFKYVNQNYLDYDMDLEKLAEKFNLSIYYLSKAFKEQTGTGFKEYIIKLRMEEARKLLGENELSITKITEKIGYVNVSHFIKTFKSIEGVTPAQFRKLRKDSERADA